MSRKKDWVWYLPELGSMATGITYGGVGVIALLSFFKVREGGADESSMLLVLNDFLLGKIIVIAILAGTSCYIVWRIYEAFTDPYQYGSSAKGIGRRFGIALSTVADALIVYAGVRVLLGSSHIQTDGQPREERAMTEALLNAGDDWVVILLGSVIVTTAIVQLIYGFTKGYKERVDEMDYSRGMLKALHILALYGYTARGIILGITGFFFLQAGILHRAQAVVNTDKAFDFIGDHVGHAFFILVAVGTICYGLFMFALGFTYKPGKSSTGSD
jgi:hypothetical protein